MKKFFTLVLLIIVALPVSAQKTNSSQNISLPGVLCFETSTNSGTTNCLGIPGENGMQGVCSAPGCYDRAKFELSTNDNNGITRYAIQIASNSSFTEGLQYISGLNRFPKPLLDLSDFLYKCEWEGTYLHKYCTAENKTYQKYNIFGLKPNTLYYLRVAALLQINVDGTFIQSEWSPAVTAATSDTSLIFDIDIAPTSDINSAPPYTLYYLDITPDDITTSKDTIYIKATTNALNGIDVLINSPNEKLISISGDSIPSYSGNFARTISGFGLRNESSTNYQLNPKDLGTIIVSSSPIDFTDTGVTAKVGGPLATFSKLFDSKDLPLLNGISGYKLKVKSSIKNNAKIYKETLTIVPYSSY